MNTFEQIKQLAKTQPNGFTINLKTFTQPTHGYAVAVEATQDSHGDNGLMKCIDYATKNNLHVGGWLDTNTNKFYYDAVMILQDKTEALAVAKENRQLAIFNLATSTTISL